VVGNVGLQIINCKRYKMGVVKSMFDSRKPIKTFLLLFCHSTMKMNLKDSLSRKFLISKFPLFVIL